METINYLPFSIDAILVAYRGAEKMDRLGYKISVADSDLFSFVVDAPSGFNYAVNLWNRTSNTSIPWCSCPQCEKEGICKHIVRCEMMANAEGQFIAEGEAREAYRCDEDYSDLMEAFENRYR